MRQNPYNNRVKEIHIGSVAGALDSAFVFDNEGRTVSQSGSSPRVMTWDAKGRMATLTQGGSAEAYRYDTSNHRIGRSGGALGNLDYYLEGEHLESVENSGVLQERYFRGASIDELVAGYTMQNGTMTPVLFAHDQVMSVVVQAPLGGGTQALRSFSAFGMSLTTVGAAITRMAYTGREDDGTGLYYYRARYYNPAVGQFASEDPKRFAAGANFLAYAGNNPVNANDPSGLYLALQVTNPDGSTYIPMTTVKNKYQVPGYGVPVGTSTAIAVPPTADPAAEVQHWASTIFNGPLPFAAYWAPGGAHDYKVTINPMYDAYGNFQYGATGNAAGYSIGVLQFAGDALKNFKNDPINKTDINSGFNAINNGGTLGTTEYLPPSLIPKIPADFGVKNPSSGWDDSSSGAAGGFLIYPNKPNTNQVQSVYFK